MLFKPEEADLLWCPLTNTPCVSLKCMGWQWEKLDCGGEAEKGFCGLVVNQGRNKIQAFNPHY